jgi:ATP-dependent RNA helicase HelY
VRVHGAANVGLLTGDSSVNGEAPIVVMTTEVLRNMMYAGSRTLEGLGFVVMDEVHYLADRFRGAVWEEVIIHLPEHVQVVSLSATVSNAEEFGEWLAEVRGNHEVVVSEHRPVPLWQHVIVGTTMFDLFAGGSTPTLRVAIPQLNPGTADGGRTSPAGVGEVAAGRAGAVGAAVEDRAVEDPRRPTAGGGASRAEVIEELDRDGLLPAITFIFSRVGCEAAVGQLLAAGVRSHARARGAADPALVEERVVPGRRGPRVLGYFGTSSTACRGVSPPTTPGMLPPSARSSRSCSPRADPAVFATETLALGINMPARTVVLEKLVKYNGEAHVDITPAEYTQLTGRAGRRGIDIEGHAVVLWARGSTRWRSAAGLDPHLPAALELPADLQHGRQPRAQVGREPGPRGPGDLVRAVPGRPGRRGHRHEGAPQRGGAARLRRGDALPPRRLPGVCRPAPQPRRRGEGRGRARSAARRAEAALSLEALRIGDVIRIPAGRRAGWAVVVQPARTGLPRLPPGRAW